MFKPLSPSYLCVCGLFHSFLFAFIVQSVTCLSVLSVRVRWLFFCRSIIVILLLFLCCPQDFHCHLLLGYLFPGNATSASVVALSFFVFFSIISGEGLSWRVPGSISCGICLPFYFFFFCAVLWLDLLAVLGKSLWEVLGLVLRIHFHLARLIGPLRVTTRTPTTTKR